MKNKITKMIMLVLVLVVTMNLAGCGAKEKDPVEKIKEAGKLVVGTSADYPPYEFHAMIDGKDTIVGFDMAIAKAIADDMGVELEIKDMDFGGLLPALSTNKVDMVIAGMTPKPERLESADFSNIYYNATHTILVKEGDEAKYTSLDDLTGKVIGVQQGSIQADIAKEEVKDPAEIKEVAKITDLVLMLTNNKVDAIILEEPVAAAYEKNMGGVAKTNVNITDSEGGSAVAVKKDNAKFVEEINKTLKKLLDEGKVDEFFAEASAINEAQQQ